MSRYDLYKLIGARFVTQNWLSIIVFWFVVAGVLRWVAPQWESIAKDGDFQFLPENLPSRVGQRLLDEAFPTQRSRSRFVVVIAREESPLSNADLAVAFDLGRRLSQRAASNIALRQRKKTQVDQTDWAHVKMLLDTSIQMDSNWFDAVKDVSPNNAELLSRRWTVAYEERSIALNVLGESENSKADRETAQLIKRPQEVRDDEIPTINEQSIWDSVMDVWTWEDPVLGSKLGAGAPHARMIVVQLDSEFMAVGNVRLMQDIERIVKEVKELHQEIESDGLEIGISGPSAVGADMMRAAALGVKQTEWISILMVLAILAVIYRGPLLVLIPLFTILISLSVSMSLVSLLAAGSKFRMGSSSVVASLSESSGGWLQVFTTTKIFLVVLLFGIGTDFCLFLISRCREGLEQKKEFSRKTIQRVVASSWNGVHDAIMGSALTTSIGLLMMVFSDFDKFRYNGIIISFSILVTLAVCLTFTPAILCGFGSLAFWPMLSSKNNKKSRATASSTGDSSELTRSFWSSIANRVIAYPAMTLLGTLMLLGIPAWNGFIQSSYVTYDFLRELSWSSPSRQGTRIIDQFFSTRDNSPVTVVIVAPEKFENDKTLREAIDKVRLALYMPGVTAVRSLTDPLGDYPPERRMGLFDQDAWRRRMLEKHRLTQTIYVANQEGLSGRAARIDILLEPDPFSADAEIVLNKISQTLSKFTEQGDSPWYKATFAYTGTTAGIADLKRVTQADQQRIQVLVTLGVWAVLFFLLRRPWFSGYLMFTVLLSYLATLGITIWFFQWAYGTDFVGLDWKVPLLLFVILIAVGQDYNVYLATRVLEEQAKHGLKTGLFKAMVSTGGIITSCGAVMAATFFSMTGGAIVAWLGGLGLPVWLGFDPDTLVLRGIVELGFALGLGVMIDTLLVRSIIVPAMFALLSNRAEQKLAVANQSTLTEG